MQHHQNPSQGLPSFGVGDIDSPYYPRPFNPAPPYRHGFPIEVSPVPIGRWASGNTGIPFLWSFEAAAAGPHVALVALTHGEELCGSHALDLFLREGLRPRNGRLSLLFNNWQAHERWDPHAPNRAFYIDDDMNRIWEPRQLDGPRRGAELDRARELRSFFDSVDVLLDLHSTQQPSPPMTLAGKPARKAAFAAAIGWPEVIVRDDGPGRLRDWAGLGAEAGTRVGLVVECGQHWRASSGPNAVRAALGLLDHLGVVDPGFASAHGWARARCALPRVVTITHTFRAHDDRAGLDDLWPDFAEVGVEGTLLGHDGVAEIRTPYPNAVLLMPVRRPRPGAVMLRIGRDTNAGNKTAATSVGS